VRDFRSRCRWEVEVLTFRDSEYVTVHPFADDAPLLKRIGWHAEGCIGVDAYWKIRGDVVFLEVSTRGLSPRPAGRYARWSAHDSVNVQVVVDAPMITRAVFEATLANLVDSGAVARLIARGRALGHSLVPV
jgi:hypothetical protein